MNNSLITNKMKIKNLLSWHSNVLSHSTHKIIVRAIIIDTNIHIVD